jgi:PAS domain-containing protein
VSAAPTDPLLDPAVARLQHEFAVMSGRLLLWERQQATLAAIAHRALVTDDLTEVLEVAVELVADALEVETLALYEHRPEGWIRAASVGLVEDRGDGGPLAHPATTLPGARVVAVPDGSGGSGWGVLIAQRDGGHEPDADDEQGFLAAVAELLGDVVAAQVRKREQRERDRTLTALVERETSFVWTAGPDGLGRTSVSAAYDRLWGRSAAHLAGHPHDWLAAIDIDDVPSVLAALERAATGGYDLRYRIWRPDGSWRLIRDRATPLLDEAGRVTRVVGLAEDVTAAATPHP